MTRRIIKYFATLIALFIYISGCSIIDYDNSARSVLTPETKNKIALCTGGLSQSIGATIKGKLDSNNVSLDALVGDEVKGLFLEKGSDEKFRNYVDCIKNISGSIGKNSEEVGEDIKDTINKRIDRVDDKLDELTPDHSDLIHDYFKNTSEDFSNLVKLIESQLASSTANIKYSAKIIDKSSNTYRKIPILIEDTIGPHKLKIAIEIFDNTETVDLTIIENLLGKYSSLDISTVFVVSRHGFTMAATKKAATIKSIKPLTMVEAQEENWGHIFNEIKDTPLHVVMTPQLKSVGVVLKEGSVLPVEKIDVKNCNILKPDGDFIEIKEWIETILRNKNILDAINKKIEKGSMHTGEITVPMHGFYLVSPQNAKYPLEKIILTSNYFFDVKTLNFEKVSYGEARIAISKTEVVGHKFDFIISEDKEGVKKIGITVSKQVGQ